MYGFTHKYDMRAVAAQLGVSINQVFTVAYGIVRLPCLYRLTDYCCEMYINDIWIETSDGNIERLLDGTYQVRPVTSKSELQNKEKCQ